MYSFFRQLDQLLSAGDRWKRRGIEFAMFFSALLEMAGVGAFVIAVRFFLQTRPALFCWVMLLTVAGLLIVKNIFAFWIVSLQAKFVYAKQETWSKALFHRYLYGDFATMRERGGADCALSLSRVSLLCDRALLPAMQLIADGMLAIVLILALAIYLPWIAFSGAFFCCVTLGAIYFVFYRKNRALGAATGRADLAAGKLASQSLDALESVRAYSGETFFETRYATYQRKLATLRAILYDFGQAPRLILESFALIYLLCLFGAMLLLGVPRETVLLDFAALIAVLSRLLPAFSRMHYSLAQVRQYQGLFDDLYRDLTVLPQAEIPLDKEIIPLAGKLEMRDLTFYYGKQKRLFFAFNFSVAPGECVGITGRTGCGKSTLFALLLGFFKPQAGEILIDGLPLEKVQDSLRRQTGVVSQQILLFGDTLRNNLTLGAEIDDGEIWRALTLARIDDFVRGLPGQLDAKVDLWGGNFSGGQRQRLAIARALCRKDLKLLLLDEATSALDAMTEAEFAETLSSLRGKMTILVISHREAALSSCDRIVALDAQ